MPCHVTSCHAIIAGELTPVSEDELFKLYHLIVGGCLSSVRPPWLLYLTPAAAGAGWGMGNKSVPAKPSPVTTSHLLPSGVGCPICVYSAEIDRCTLHYVGRCVVLLAHNVVPPSKSKCDLKSETKSEWRVNDEGVVMNA